MSEPARKPDIDVAEYERRLRPTAPRQDDPLVELARLVNAAPAPRKPQPVDALSPAARAALTADEEDFLNELSLAVDRVQHQDRYEPAPPPVRDLEIISRAQAAVDRAATETLESAADVRKAAAEAKAVAQAERAAPVENASAAIEIPALKAQAALRGGLDLGGLEEMTRLEDIARVSPPSVEAPSLPKVNLHAPVFPRPLTAQAAPASILVEPRLADPLDERRDPPHASRPAPAAPRDLDAQLPGEDGFEAVAPVAAAAAQTPPPARGRRAMAAVVALLGVGLAATGVALTMKRGPSAANGEPPTILASADPVKTAPPAAPSAPTDKADDLLARKPAGARPDAAAKAVGKPEEPVDLAREAQKVVRTIPIAGMQDPAVPRTPTGDSANPDRLGSIFPEPRRVRTVSVRPDGAIIGGDAVPAATKPPATPAPAPVAAIPPPPIAAPPPAAAPATPAEEPRVAPRPRAAAPATQTPAVTPAPAPKRPAVVEKPAEPKAEKPAPAPVRRAAPPQATAAPQAEPEAAEQVEQVRNPFSNLFGRKEQAQPAPTTTASTSAAAPTADDEDAAPAKPAARTNVGSGSFAVQLSSSPSEGDARAAASRLGGRFASQLGGRSARVVKGEAGGKTVYRVRAGGMSREGAAAACASIKSSGGSCFVAQD